MANKYWATGINGGTEGFMDLIDPTDTDGSATALVAGDICDVDEDDMISKYIARDSAGASESYPDVIIPDNNPSDFWWELIEQIPQNTGMIDQLLYENMPGAF
jgi:hypothetical protein